jgi:Domain of Unknown Function (DUF1080)
MTRFLSFLSLAIRSIACGALIVSAPHQLRADQALTGFASLFNGKDLSGWYGWSTRNPHELWNMTPEEQAKYKRESIEGGLLDKKGNPAEDHLKAHWRVENGELVNDGKGLYLTTDKDYGDIELMLEYKALPDGDSGVYLRGIPQIQIWDSTKGDPRGLGQDKGSGGLWNNLGLANNFVPAGKDPLKKMDKPFGEWNQIYVKMIGERVTVKLNGEVVVDNQVLENYFANNSAGYAAYKKAKDPEKQSALPPLVNDKMLDPIPAKGPIQLQTHGSEIRWRNLYVREIGSEEANKHLASEKSDGFVELVNGKDLNNWRGAVDNYEVKDGSIACKKGKGGDLLTAEDYEDCIIRTEFKLPKAGNNGIAIRTPIDGHSSKDGLELQVIDSDGYNAAHGGKVLKPTQYHGSLYFCVGAKHGYLRPVGEWNYQEIEIRGQKIQVTLNGTKILDVDIDKIDRSTLSTVPKGLDHRTGRLGFAGHNDPVEFRSFKVKRL